LSAQLEITKSETWEGESKETWQVSRNVSGTEGKHGRYAPAMSLEGLSPWQAQSQTCHYVFYLKGLFLV
jgi:hypothetical protein